MKFKLRGILFVSVLFSTICFSQENQSGSVNVISGQWKPAKINADGSNSLNGVEFYKRPSECDSKKVALIKVRNSNNYPVRISWKENEILKSVVVPALGGIEGSCQAFNEIKESPQKMLVFVKTTEDKQMMRNRFLSSLSVVEEKK